MLHFMATTDQIRFRLGLRLLFVCTSILNVSHYFVTSLFQRSVFVFVSVSQLSLIMCFATSKINFLTIAYFSKARCSLYFVLKVPLNLNKPILPIKYKTFWQVNNLHYILCRFLDEMHGSHYFVFNLWVLSSLSAYRSINRMLCLCSVEVWP